MTKGFDLILYPSVIYLYGIVWGGLVMIILSFFVTWGEFVFYDWSKKDWLGIEALKSIKDFNPKPIPKYLVGRITVSIANAVGSFTAWILKKSDPVVMVVLSIQFEPFITVIYMRHGASRYNGLSSRDWKVFIVSVLISNVYWTLAVYTGITIVESIWRFIALLL